MKAKREVRVKEAVTVLHNQNTTTGFYCLKSVPESANPTEVEKPNSQVDE